MKAQSVPSSGDTYGAILPVTERDEAHRKGFVLYVEKDAQPFHRQHLTRLQVLWREWNTAYFSGALMEPYLTLSAPASPQRYGETSLVSSFGGKLEIRLRPSLLTGKHPDVRSEDTFAEGRFLFVADVLLHETVHQYHMEVSGETEESFHGHGPQFAAFCNQIGADLGLPPVRSSKKRGENKHLPSCAQWPHNVRGPDYYQGAYVVPAKGDTEPEPEPEPEPDTRINIPMAIEEIQGALEGIEELYSEVETENAQDILSIMAWELESALEKLGVPSKMPQAQPVEEEAAQEREPTDVPSTEDIILTVMALQDRQPAVPADQLVEAVVNGLRAHHPTLKGRDMDTDDLRQLIYTAVPTLAPTD